MWSKVTIFSTWPCKLEVLSWNMVRFFCSNKKNIIWKRRSPRTENETAKRQPENEIGPLSRHSCSKYRFDMCQRAHWGVEDMAPLTIRIPSSCVLWISRWLVSSTAHCILKRITDDHRSERISPVNRWFDTWNKAKVKWWNNCWQFSLLSRYKEFASTPNIALYSAVLYTTRNSLWN